MAKVTTFEELAMHGLKDIYSAEHQIIAALPEMSKAATSPELKASFDLHLTQTKVQVERLEKIFKKMNEQPGGVTCLAAKGLIAEAKENIKEIEAGPLLDAALIGSAQRVEHYEIAAYGTARTFAQQLGDTEAVALLEETLKEEEATDKKLTQVALSVVNPKAGQKK